MNVNTEIPNLYGLVVANFGATILVETTDEKQINCTVKSKLENPVCGDQVEVQLVSENEGVIVCILPRTTILGRPDRKGAIKPIAANINQVFIVSAPKPAVDFGLLDRYLVAAELLNIHPVIVLNKTDLLSEQQLEEYNEKFSIYRTIGYPVLFLSTQSGQGIELIKDILPGHRNIFVGLSGVGKSSLIQKLLPESVLRIGKISTNTGQGRHTTTTAQLFHLAEGGEIIDSPGVREFRLWNISGEELARGYREIREQLGKCKFRDCIHRNEPGCAVISAVEKGDISQRRYRSYLSTLDSLHE